MSGSIFPLTRDQLVALEFQIPRLSMQELADLREQCIREIIRSARVPLTRSERRVYAAVLRHGPAQALQIARLLHRDKGNVHRQLQALVRKNLIRRSVRGELILYRGNFFTPAPSTTADNYRQPPTTP